MIKAILIEPKKKPKIIELNDTLKELQRLVGGYIEYVYNPFLKDIAFICNDEGKILNLEPNIDFGYDVLCGNVIIVGDNHNGENSSLSEEQIKILMEVFE